MNKQILSEARALLHEADGRGGYRWGKRKEDKVGADGQKLFKSYHEWRAACRLTAGFSKFDGDPDEVIEAVFLTNGTSAKWADGEGYIKAPTTAALGTMYHDLHQRDVKRGQARKRWYADNGNPLA